LILLEEKNLEKRPLGGGSRVYSNHAKKYAKNQFVEDTKKTCRE